MAVNQVHQRSHASMHRHKLGPSILFNGIHYGEQFSLLAYLKQNITFENLTKLGIMVHTYNPSTQEAETEGPQIQGQPDLKIEFLSVKNKNKTKWGGIKLWAIKT